MTVKKKFQRKKLSDRLNEITKALRSNTARCVYVLLAATALLTLIFILGISPKRYDLKVGDISPYTITASKDVVDEISTSALREEAARQVEPSYVYKDGVAAEVKQTLKTILAEVKNVREYGNSVLSAASGTQGAYQFTREELDYAKALLPDLTLADYQISTLMRADEQQINDMCTNITSAVENTLNTSIREGYTSDSVTYLQQIIGYKTELALLQNVVTPILRKVIQPNMVIDQEATEKLRQEARNSVEPVVFSQGQNIVVAREKVTANQLEMLRSLGLLDNDELDLTIYAGTIVLVLLTVVILAVALYFFSPQTLNSPKKLLILSLAMCLAFLLCVIGKKIQTYMLPVLLCPMLLCVLLGPNAAGCTILCVVPLMGTFLGGGDTSYDTELLNLCVTSVISGYLAIYLIYKKPYRQQILLSGLVAAAVNLICMLMVGFLTSTSVSDVFTNGLWSAGSACVSAILCIALTPVFETIFHLAAPTKLLELSNPNHPLLRKLMIEASGTYHHSIIVANLAEAAAESVHANPLLARVGAYFHDIGKLKRPLYFKENQMGENPHDHTNPYVSAAIVTAHTRDGVAMAQQYRLPMEIQDIITEHHGDTPVMYFYHKAVQESNGVPVDITDFRYDGKKPQSKESAIIMLADTVEAAVRSMPDPTPEKIKAFIEKLTRGKLDDGQLDEAPITLQDLALIQKAFCTVLNGVFHERIEYPDISPTAAAHIAETNSAQPVAPAPVESTVEEKELRKVQAEPTAGNEFSQIQDEAGEQK